jgi:tRNASer (uridine44-2'-O)-methyltransferase
MYRIWLASLSLHCGWQVECEMLRIPSTRNWAIIGKIISELLVFTKVYHQIDRQEKDYEWSTRRGG